MNAIWPGGDPRNVAHAIVSAPPYTSAPAAASPNLVAIALHWLGDRLAPLFAALGRALHLERTFALPIVVALLAVVAVAIVVIALRLIERWVLARPGRSRPRGARRESTAGSADWLARARAAAREERWRDAAASLVRAALLRYAEAGRLPYDPARTPAEARRALREPAFDAFARDADLALFAASAATPERFERMHAAYAAMEPPA